MMLFFFNGFNLFSLDLTVGAPHPLIPLLVELGLKSVDFSHFSEHCFLCVIEYLILSLNFLGIFSLFTPLFQVVDE